MVGTMQGATSDTSLQPSLISLPTGVPVQLPNQSNGVTIVNQGEVSVQLCSDQNFSTPVLLDIGVSMPWSTDNGPLWALSTTATEVLVLPELFNYFNPNLLPPAYDILYTNNNLVIPHGGIGFNTTVIAKGTYQAVEVLLAQEAASPGAVAISMSNEATGQQVVITQPPTGLDQRFIALLACTAGDTIAVNFFCASASFVTEAQILGFREAPITEIVNAPNTTLNVSNVGGLVLTGISVTAGASGTLINAPPLGHALRLQNVSANGNASGSGNILIGVLSLAYPIIIPYPGGNANANGQLFTQALSVLNLTSGTVSVWASYDIVTVPQTGG
jgi:hypothetical protein